MGNFFEDIPGFSDFDSLFNHDYHTVSYTHLTLPTIYSV